MFKPDTIPKDLEPHDGRFVGRTHWFACRVYFEDTDFSGVVYHANYLRYCERARSDMLRCIGIDQRAAFEAGQGAYAIADLAIKYMRPARMDDSLLIASQVVQIRAAACHIHQRVMRRDKDGGIEDIAQATIVAALIGPQGRPKRQPPGWIAAFETVLNPEERESPIP